MPPYLCTEMRKLLRVIHIVLWLSACTAPQKNKQKIFRYNQETSISSLDPAFARDQANIWAVTQLYNGLTELDSASRVRPSLATHWEVENSGKLYRFFLRTDVYFHNNPCFPKQNRRLTAQDVAYSFRRLMDPAIASPGAWIFNDKTSGPDAFRVLNDSVLEISLNRPFPPFPGLLSMPYCFVVPQEAVSFYGKEFRSNPVGSGPFMMHHWEEGVKLLLKRNPAYFETGAHGRLPYLEGVEVTFIENKQTAFMSFVQGELDFFNGLEGSFKDEVLTSRGELRDKYKGKFVLKTGPYLNTEYFGFVLEDSMQVSGNKQLLNKNLRKAISFSIDRDKMMAYLRNGIGIPGNRGFIPEGLPGHARREYYRYNPDSAQYYLRKAEFPGGKGLSELVLYTNKNYTDITLFIQSELKRAGIPSRIEVNPGPFHRERVSKLQLPFFRASWLADYPDAENYLALFYSPNFAPLGPNYTHYKNRTFDRLYNQALEETDENKRAEIYREMDALVMEDAPVLVLFYDETLHLIQNEVKGLSGGAMNPLVLKNVRK